MLSFFKRPKSAIAKPNQAAEIISTSSDSKERRLLPRPLPSPEVIEGDDESAWSLWEESISFQDSQLEYQETIPLPLHGREAKPSAESEIVDPFNRIHKNSS
jgi:hypothetical protein